VNGLLHKGSGRALNLPGKEIMKTIFKILALCLLLPLCFLFFMFGYFLFEADAWLWFGVCYVLLGAMEACIFKMLLD